jgi:hypothetical protein
MQRFPNSLVPRSPDLSGASVLAMTSRLCDKIKNRRREHPLREVLILVPIETDNFCPVARAGGSAA